MEVFEEMAIEDEVKEVKEVLDSHKQTLKVHEDRLDTHDDKITELEIKNAGFAERFNSIDTTLARVENTTLQNLQTSNLLINTISQIAIGNAKSNNDIAKAETKGGTEITKIKLNNNTKVVLKVLALVSLLISAFVAGKYGIKI